MPSDQRVSEADQSDIPLRARLASLLGASNVTPVGASMGATIYRSDTGAIVRVARSATATDTHARLRHLLPRIAPDLPIPIPIPTAELPPSNVLPHGALVYPALPGETATAARLSPTHARQLATFMVALHAIAPPAAPEAPRLVDDDHWRALRDIVAPACRDLLSQAENRILAAWWNRFLAAPERARVAPTLCHGDLWHENLLLDDTGTTIVGVIDWETMNVGDPAQDLAPLRHAGEPFAAAAIRAYVDLSERSDPLLARRAEWLWEAREFDGLRIAIEQDDGPEIEDAIAKIRRGPILVGATS